MYVGAGLSFVEGVKCVQKENQWKKPFSDFFHARLVIYNNEIPLFNFLFRFVCSEKEQEENEK